MRRWSRLWASIFTLLCAASAFGQTPAPACTTAEHRAFDFWVGDWNVYGPKGKLAGTNRITREYDGCVVHEHYETGRGYSGESLNMYDASRKVWHQTWVDTSGLLLVLEGTVQDGKMRMQGRTQGADGVVSLQRITWTPQSDGSVRQLWESSDPQGNWSVVFDGKYTRK